jgi:hypothetical protein
MNARSIAFVVAALAAASFPAAALAGREIMQNVDAVKKPRFSHSAVKMELVDKTGGVEVRQIEEWGKNENDLTSVVMAFHTPASVKDTRFLQVENKDKADDKWIYLPALRSSAGWPAPRATSPSGKPTPPTTT